MAVDRSVKKEKSDQKNNTGKNEIITALSFPIYYESFYCNER